MPKRFLGVLLAISGLAPALKAQNRAEYVGGTAAKLESGDSGSIDLTDDHYLAFYARGRKGSPGQVRVLYDHVNLVEYGQKVDRRLLLAAVISPMFLLSKQRRHFLTIGYTDEEGRQQALVFRVDKNGIRSILVGLEARTGLKVEYQDEEARKAGKG